MTTLPVLYNTYTRSLEPFVPRISGQASLYVCGPTVYDRAHLGNARPYVVFDVLVKLLQECGLQVTYVRNITDIDDKIIAASQKTGEPIHEITARTTRLFQEDMAAIGVAPPTVEPRATDHVGEMIAMIEQLLARGVAYEAEGHVLFHVPAYPEYGKLSRCRQDEMIAGARVDVAPFKKNPADFVLWKPSSDDVPGWDSPWGRGRPGWHIECSAMSLKHLGATFDIHAGGQDLIFPHHENEIAQSQAALGPDTFARLWMHNGILLVGGEKMSKSLGNFVTVTEALTNLPGEVIRLALLATHYRGALDWTDTGLQQAKAGLNRLYTALEGAPLDQGEIDQGVLVALRDDLNTPLAIARLHEMASAINKEQDPSAKQKTQQDLRTSARLLGLLQRPSLDWFQGETDDAAAIETQIQARQDARANKQFKEADQIRADLLAQGIELLDGPQGTTWRRV